MMHADGASKLDLSLRKSIVPVIGSEDLALLCIVVFVAQNGEYKQFEGFYFRCLLYI